MVTVLVPQDNFKQLQIKNLKNCKDIFLTVRFLLKLKLEISLNSDIIKDTPHMIKYMLKKRQSN